MLSNIVNVQACNDTMNGDENRPGVAFKCKVPGTKNMSTVFPKSLDASKDANNKLWEAS